MTGTEAFSRRGFVGAVSAASTAAVLMGVTGAQAFVKASNIAAVGENKLPKTYYIKNVLLDRGYERDGDLIVATKTEVKTLLIKDGKISAILDDGAKLDASIQAVDAENLLLLPAFQDIHIHLDKTFYGGAWRAVRPNPNGIFDRIAEEQKILPKMLETAEERTEKMIELLQGMGVVFARSHCNIEPTSKLKSLEHLMNVLKRHKDDFGCEIVAFPQHGLLHSDSVGLMRDAMKMGANMVGGLDPNRVDKNMTKSLDATFQIATDFKAPIDYHLHEIKEDGYNSIRRIIKLTKEAKMQGKVTISHAYALAFLPDYVVTDLAEQFVEADISLATGLPLSNWAMPIPTLWERGVKIGIGTDSVIDHWSPFGRCDILERTRLACEVYDWDKEEMLANALRLGTNNISVLDEKGNIAWPKVGDKADMVFVSASCTAEAVARTPARSAVFREGALIAGSLKA